MKKIRDLVHPDDLVSPDYDNIRDLMLSTPPVDPGRTSAEDRAGVALPGDPVEGISNPYVGKNPQAVLRLLRSGALSPDQEVLAREAVEIFEGFSGEYLTGGIGRAVPIPKRTAGPTPSRAVDGDVVENPDYDPDLADLFR